MINNKLKNCCETCAYLALDYQTIYKRDSLDAMDNTDAITHIYCKHYKVCKDYIEEDIGMTNEEAIQECKARMVSNYGCGTRTSPTEFYEKCLEALEKVPKKVKKGKINEYMGYYCQHCKRELVSDGEWDFCMWCGNALKWS